MSPPIRFTLNGTEVQFDGPPGTPLIDLLRDHFALRGTRLACARGVCGSCTVLVDDAPAASCSLFAYRIDGHQIRTIEGLSPTDPVAAAFADHASFQCGYCTSGMIMLATALLAHTPDPSRETVVEWMSSGVCRCTGYSMIIEAVLDAAARTRQARNAA